jgi:hypothetical protein
LVAREEDAVHLQNVSDLPEVVEVLIDNEWRGNVLNKVLSHHAVVRILLLGGHTLLIGKGHFSVGQFNDSLDVAPVVIRTRLVGWVVHEEPSVRKPNYLDFWVCIENITRNCVQPSIGCKTTSRTSINHNGVGQLRWQE